MSVHSDVADATAFRDLIRVGTRDEPELGGGVTHRDMAHSRFRAAHEKTPVA